MKNLGEQSGWDIDEPGYLDCLFHGYLPKLERKVSESGSHRTRILSQPKLYYPQTPLASSIKQQSQQSNNIQPSLLFNLQRPTTTKFKIRYRLSSQSQFIDEQPKKCNKSQSPKKTKPKYTVINMSQLLCITPKIKIHHDQLNKVLERFSKKK